MPFDGSGNFSRLYSWQQDRDNGIHILASRMDGEFDNFAAGMNVVFFRNGLVPMSGNINMGQNYIIGLGAGSVGALPFRFADDPNSGLFLNGYNKPSMVAGGVTRLEANTGGVAVTGTLNSSGALTQNGQQVWHAGNFTPGNYGGLASNNVWTGTNKWQGTATVEQGATPGRVDLLRSGVLTWGVGGYPGGGNMFGVQLNLVAPFFTIDTGGSAAFTGPLAVGGAITQAGNQVWHAGNFNPANYGALAGTNTWSGVNTFNNQIDVAGGNYLRLTNTPFARSSGTTQFIISGSGGIAFRNSADSANIAYMGATGSLDVVGALTQNGQQVWHAGNLPSPAALTGAAFTGASSVTRTGDGDAFSVGKSGGAQLNFFTSSSIVGLFNAAGAGAGRDGIQIGADFVSFDINATEVGRFNASGLTVVGNVTKSGAGNYMFWGSGSLSGNWSRGTAAPSGGSDGDFYVQYV